MANKKYLTDHKSNVQNNSFFFVFFSLDKNDNRPQVFMQLMPLLKHTFALCPVNVRKKKDAEWSDYFTIILQPLVFIVSSLETHCICFWSHTFSK